MNCTYASKSIPWGKISMLIQSLLAEYMCLSEKHPYALSCRTSIRSRNCYICLDPHLEVFDILTSKEFIYSLLQTHTLFCWSLAHMEERQIARMYPKTWCLRKGSDWFWDYAKELLKKAEPLVIWMKELHFWLFIESLFGW